MRLDPDFFFVLVTPKYEIVLILGIKEKKKKHRVNKKKSKWIKK